MQYNKTKKYFIASKIFLEFLKRINLRKSICNLFIIRLSALITRHIR